MIRSVLFGGTFDPLHNGHLALAQTVCAYFKPDEFWFVPAGYPPHKEKCLFTFEQRYELIEQIISDHPLWRLTDLDKPFEEKNYTIHLIRRFQKDYPNRKLYFVIGEDNVIKLQTWKEYQRLLDCIDFIVVSRTTENKELFRSLPYYQKLHFIPMQPVDLSSSCIREKLKSHEDIQEYIPEKIFLKLKSFL